MESTANYSITPLAIQRVYIGTWEKSLYPYAIVTLYANSSTEISCYQSLNKTHTEVVKFQTTADEYFTCNISLNSWGKPVGFTPSPEPFNVVSVRHYCFWTVYEK